MPIFQTRQIFPATRNLQHNEFFDGLRKTGTKHNDTNKLEHHQKSNSI